jgi:predicted negative regulator of RcsB-dependent stress response
MMRLLAVVATVAVVAIAGMMGHRQWRAYQARQAAELAANKQWYRETCEDAREANTSIHPSTAEELYCGAYERGLREGWWE